MTTMKLNITFDKYEFRRVKHMGTNAVVYTGRAWVGKDVCLIPMPITMTDRYIETQKRDDGLYHLEVEVNEIVFKTIKDATQTGRAYINKKFIGLDMLIVEAPKLEHF